jgi:preprotein translocase subunit YajC
MTGPAAAEPPFFLGATHVTAFIHLLAQGEGGGGGLATVIIPLLLMVAIFYFLLIRPQQRRVRQQRELVSNLDVGDEVITIGGVYGRILRMDDESVTLAVGDGVEIRFVKNAVARKLVVGSHDEEAGGTP